MVRAILFLIVGACFFWSAIVYGSIWQSQHAPGDVTVEFPNGTTQSGLLQQQWDRSFSLTLADGMSLALPDFQQLVLHFRPAAHARTYWELWRAWAPPLVVAFLTVLLGARIFGRER
ncbi:MAG: hypothetical protein KAX55_09775 [Propionivibrio sp.]|nr:hypothetical protein [Propionivibrio sp.]